MKKLAPLAALLLLAACVSVPEPAPAPAIGRFYHYVRSNQDGSLPEQIYQYRASETRIEVGKEVARCTNAAFVTAEFDPARGQGVRFVGGRLGRDLEQEPFAYLDYDAASRTLSANVPAMNIEARATIAGEPFILYDFDLSDLNARFAGRAAPREDFRFAVALIWPEEGAANVLRTPGGAEARLAGEEARLGRTALRYDVSDGLNGQLWLDARDGHVLEARFAEPNHVEYADFRMVLQRMDDNGAEAWRAARAAHWEGCE
jgi:hypothetical protein